MSCAKLKGDFCKPECLEDYGKKVAYRNFKHTVKEIYKNEGYLGFSKGIVPRMILIAPSAAISWGTYEVFKKMLTRDS